VQAVAAACLLGPYVRSPMGLGEVARENAPERARAVGEPTVTFVYMTWASGTEDTQSQLVSAVPVLSLQETPSECFLLVKEIPRFPFQVFFRTSSNQNTHVEDGRPRASEKGVAAATATAIGVAAAHWRQRRVRACGQPPPGIAAGSRRGRPPSYIQSLSDKG